MLMKPSVTRGEIAEVLRRWQQGSMSGEEVHAWANSLYFPGEVNLDDWETDGEEENSVANEVLAQLDNLGMNLVIRDDVPIYLEFLRTPRGSFAEGYRKFREAIDSIDYKARLKSLREIPLYAPFCK
jgi:hypothetical protein